MWSCSRDEGEGFPPIVGEPGADDARGSAETFRLEVAEEGEHGAAPGAGLPHHYAVPQASFRFLRSAPPDPKRFLVLSGIIVHTDSLPSNLVRRPGFVSSAQQTDGPEWAPRTAIPRKNVAAPIGTSLAWDTEA